MTNRFVEMLRGGGRRLPGSIEQAEAYLHEGRYLFGDIGACTPLRYKLNADDNCEFLWGLRQSTGHTNCEKIMIALRAAAEPRFIPQIIRVYEKEMRNFHTLCGEARLAAQLFSLEKRIVTEFQECEQALLWQNVVVSQ